MGLLRPEGMLSGFTRQKDWEAIGYQVLKGSFSSPGQTITLYRPPENSPNPVPQVGKQPVLEFETYSNRIDELTALAAHIRHNLEVDGLNKSRDIRIGHYPMYEEMRRAIESGDTFTFTYQRPSKWDISTD